MNKYIVTQQEPDGSYVDFNVEADQAHVERGTLLFYAKKEQQKSTIVVVSQNEEKELVASFGHFARFQKEGSIK